MSNPNPETDNIEVTDIEAQAHQTCHNIKAVLEAAGSSLEKVVKTTCFLQHISDFVAFNAVYEKYFTGNLPVAVLKLVLFQKAHW